VAGVMTDEEKYEKVRKIVSDIAYYVGQGLTSKELDTFTKRILRTVKEK
jgi:hypothetical protein